MSRQTVLRTTIRQNELLACDMLTKAIDDLVCVRLGLLKPNVVDVASALSALSDKINETLSVYVSSQERST